MTEPRNRVVQVRRFGDPDGFEVVDAPVPTAGRGEVRVRVLASSVQHTDVLIRRHLYPQTMHRRAPFVIGYDVVGEIDQLGEGVSGLQVGDRVADMTVVGSNATYRTLRSTRRTLLRIPGVSGRSSPLSETILCGRDLQPQYLEHLEQMRAARDAGFTCLSWVHHWRNPSCN